ncbi:hypothetical protein H310_12690 [Aphanomyces invadans]|uniref:Uncharacterized protein n=1 Tax=Aphanomyces invadans TaxID=157072 RepID=A0A024TGW9_9STRA|nr:hypothetical protein H310_12690 [Aphanomyces invadans]ETV93254.1 hypothetical protein H310_12690 [Aphanomyces invadans]|eukprot:XP_008878089.1 hypothetical protein H310_12690 [Aphanomyces invadans]
MDGRRSHLYALKLDASVSWSMIQGLLSPCTARLLLVPPGRRNCSRGGHSSDRLGRAKATSTFVVAKTTVAVFGFAFSSRMAWYQLYLSRFTELGAAPPGYLKVVNVHTDRPVGEKLDGFTSGGL